MWTYSLQGQSGLEDHELVFVGGRLSSWAPRAVSPEEAAAAIEAQREFGESMSRASQSFLGRNRGKSSEATQEACSAQCTSQAAVCERRCGYVYLCRSDCKADERVCTESCLRN